MILGTGEFTGLEIDRNLTNPEIKFNVFLQIYANPAQKLPVAG